MTMDPHNLTQPISALTTPCCLIEKSTLQNNIARLAKHIGGLGCKIRPHVKTHKSMAVTQEIIAGGHTQGITVSTLKEARYFFEQGITDILYAVGIVPTKLAQAATLIESGCRLTLVLDNVEMARLVIEKTQDYPCPFRMMIELDTDGHRSGINPNSDELLALGELLHNTDNIEFIGVMTHAGESYSCFTPDAKTAMARQERDLSLLAAARLRNAGFPCPEVSIGSTPTAFFVDDLTGITEVRAGVYVFFDLVMSGLGVCQEDDIAISVLASIIGHQKEKGWVITDAGWMATSRDRGTGQHPIDQGYGLVRNAQGEDLGNYIVADANQEHGIIRQRNADKSTDFTLFPLAGQVRILPNHACSTAAQFDHYIVVENEKVVATWSSVGGW